MKFLINLTLIFFSVLLTGCGAKLAEMKYENSPLSMDHINPIQSTSVAAGSILGGVIIGIPLAILTLPITLPIHLLDEESKGLIFIAPIMLPAYITGAITGTITWPFFGWYYFDDEKTKYKGYRIIHESNKTAS